MYQKRPSSKPRSIDLIMSSTDDWRLRAFDDAIDWTRRRFFAFLFGPETRVGQVLHHAIAHKIDLLRRQTCLRRLRTGQFRMPRIAVDVDAFVEDLLADFCLSARRGEWTASFFSTASVEIESEEPEQIGDCLRLENRRIDTGFEHARITRVERFANRFVGDARGVEFRNVEMVAQEVA